ncbi:MAG: radical SAM protein [Veillonellaceae bacterium]|nr:radical SAM protein [Veillonellaceae bacterium]
MIGFTKLLCGTATISDVMRQRHGHGAMPANLLQFSSERSPVVVWNITSQCNLKCRHCYIEATEAAKDNEMTTADGMAFIDDLAEMKVPVLMFSGGEPLVRPDLFELAAYAVEKGLRIVLSTNGTLIDDFTAQLIKDAGFQYVGVSIDGCEETHDMFRGEKGAFAAAIAGIRAAKAAGNRTGVRFTLNSLNKRDLPAVLDLIEQEKIDRFCMYHLVYAGRGGDMKNLDVTLDEKREVAQLLIDKALDFDRRGVELEILTTDNHADGLYLLDYIAKTNPARVPEVRQLLELHGGCSAGDRMADVDYLGNVHPCQFWSDLTLGNVRERKFSEIWNDLEANDGILARLRTKPAQLNAQCGKCSQNRLCGGCRIRASVDGDIWGDDPACFWTDVAKEAKKC